MQIGFFPPLFEIRVENLESTGNLMTSNMDLDQKRSTAQLSNPKSNDGEEPLIEDEWASIAGLDIAMGTWASWMMLLDGLAVAMGPKWDWSAKISPILMIAGISAFLGYLYYYGESKKIYFALMLISIITAIITAATSFLRGKFIGAEKILTDPYLKVLWVALTICGIITNILGYPVLPLDDTADIVLSMIDLTVAAILWGVAISAEILIYKYCPINWKIPHTVLALSAIIFSVIFIIKWLTFLQ